MKRQHVVLIVVYTMAIISLTYVFVLAYCLVTQHPVNETLGAFTHVGDSVTGALLALLVRTSSEDQTQKTEITNQQPIPVTETPK